MTSKEGLATRGSVTSKKTPQHTSESVKGSGMCTTKPNTLNNSDNVNGLGSSNTIELSKSDKSKKKNTLKNCKSQTCFEKNPINSKSKFNRLRKIKHDLDKQQNLINEIHNIKDRTDKQRVNKLKRSTSRNSRRNSQFTGQPNDVKNKNLLTRSRSKTDFDSSTKNEVEKVNESKKQPKKTTMYTLNEKHQKKLSRNNSRDPKMLATSTYKTNLKKDSYCTYINSKTIAGRKKAATSNSKQKYTYVTKKPKTKKKSTKKEIPTIGNVRSINLASTKEHKEGYKTSSGLHKKSLSTMFKMKSQERRSSHTRNTHFGTHTNKHCEGISR